MQFPGENEFETNEDERCTHLTQDGKNSCSRTYGHDGRHIQHDAEGRAVYGWRGDAFSSFRLLESDALAAV